MWWFNTDRAIFRRRLKNAVVYCSGLQGFFAVKKTNQILLPLICHSGDSHNLSVSIDLSNADSKTAAQSDAKYMEIELQAAGLNVNGDFKQRQPLTSSIATYLWNCNFANAGNHVINLVYRIVDKSHDVKQDLGSTSFNVQAIRLYRQYGFAIFAAVTTVVSLTLAALQALR